ncbi:MAG: hypothetical protein IPF87_08530 [Gemmatimonadetes bacterium]|nr:hypothetical protein [Gemmatimonadota bacterium]
MNASTLRGVTPKRSAAVRHCEERRIAPGGKRAECHHARHHLVERAQQRGDEAQHRHRDRLPLHRDPHRTFEEVDESAHAYVRRPADLDGLVTHLGPLEDGDRNVRHVIDGDVVGALVPVPEEHRLPLLAHRLGENEVDPDFHECRRLQQHPRDAALAHHFVHLVLHAEVVDHAIGREPARRHMQPARDPASLAARQRAVRLDVDPGRAGRAASLHVVGCRDHLPCPAGLPHAPCVAEVGRDDLGAEVGEGAQRLESARERPDREALGKEQAHDRAAELP